MGLNYLNFSNVSGCVTAGMQPMCLIFYFFFLMVPILHNFKYAEHYICSRCHSGTSVVHNFACSFYLIET